ncbi:MAG: flagellar biosynthesis protein FlgN [Paracoccaceae bacterium]
MAVDGASELIDALGDVVDQERQAILEGDLGRLSKLVERKADLADQLATCEGLDEDRIVGLNDKFHRNQDLLQSAMDGVRQVAERLKQLQAAQSGLNVYDGKGQAHRYGTNGRPSMLRRV